jgi:hypothetical protein
VGSSSQRRTHFVAAALPKVPIRALKLGDEAFLAHDIRGFHSGLRHARSTRAAAPLIQFRGLVWPGRFSPEGVFHPLEKCPIVTAAHAFLGGGTPKSPYTRHPARRQDLCNRRSACNRSRV